MMVDMLKRLWAVLKGIGIAIGATAAWLFGLFLGLTWFLHGINGYPRCEGVEPGESCAFSSARGTKRVDYEDLEQVDLFSLVLGSVTLLVLAGMLLAVVFLGIDAWRTWRSG